MTSLINSALHLCRISKSNNTYIFFKTMKYNIVIIQVFDRCRLYSARIIPILTPIGTLQGSSHRISILFSFDSKQWVRKYSLCRELKGSHNCVVSCCEYTLLGRRLETKYSCILGRYRVHCSMKFHTGRVVQVT